MEIEVSRDKKQNYIHFSSLNIGDTFATDRNDLGNVWVRIEDIRYVPAAVNLICGKIEYFQPTTPIVPLEVKLIVKEK